MKTLVIANNKGGVGKTTLTAHLAYQAREAGKRVLLVDFDAQGSLSLSFPAEVKGEIGLVASDLLASPFPDDKQPIKVDKRCSIIPADSGLHDLLVADTDAIARAAGALARYSEKFDLCLIDTPPGRSSLFIAALCAADQVVTPMAPGLYEQNGVKDLFHNIAVVRKMLNPKLQHMGVVLVKTNIRSGREAAILAGMREQFGHLIIKGELPERIAVRNAVAELKPVWLKPRGSSHEKAAAEWKAVCKTILGRVFK